MLGRSKGHLVLKTIHWSQSLHHGLRQKNLIEWLGMGHMRISWLRNDKIEIAKTDLLEVCLLKEGETPMIPFSFSKYFTYSFVYFIYWSLLFYVNEYFYVLILLLLPRSWVIRCDWCLIKIMFPSMKKKGERENGREHKSES